MTEAAIVQTIATLGLIIVAIVTAIATHTNGRNLQRMSLDVSEVRSQTQNSHSKNMRDDMDSKHNAIVDAIANVRDDVGAMREDVGGLHRDITDLHRADIVQQRALRLSVAERREEIAAVEAVVAEQLKQHSVHCALRSIPLPSVQDGG